MTFSLKHTGTDDNSGTGDGIVWWFDLSEDHEAHTRDEAQTIGLHSGGAFLDSDGAEITEPNRHLSWRARRAMSDFTRGD